MIKRPFYAGRELPSKEYFFDREKETKRLKLILSSESPVNLALFGERRTGKTTLIKKLARDIKEKNSVVIKCEKLLPLDEETFFKNLIKELIQKHSGKAELVKEKVKEIANQTKLGLTWEELTFWIDLSEKKVNLKELMDKAFKIISVLNSKKPTIVFLDEFQELFKFGNEFLWAFRAYISDSQASFVVSSSWHRFVEKLKDETHPFFNFFEVIELKEVDELDTRKYLKKQIQRVEMEFQPEVIDKIVSESRLKPFYIQLLALKCFENAAVENKKSIDLDIYNKAFKDTLNNIPNYLLADYHKLRGKTKEIFELICLYDLEKPAEIGVKLKMNPSNVIQILNQIMQSYDLIKKIDSNYFVKDDFLKAFVKEEKSRK